MKIKQIASLSAKSKMFCLYDVIDATGEVLGQWLGDGFAAYPLDGLPYMIEPTLCALFDITEKQRETYFFRHGPSPDGVCLDNMDSTEMKLDKENFSIAFGGKVLRPFQTRAGITFIETKYLSPVADVLEILEFFERATPAGVTYIALKAGSVLQGIIFPYDLISEKFVTQLESLTAECRRAYERKQDAERRRTAAALAKEDDA